MIANEFKFIGYVTEIGERDFELEVTFDEKGNFNYYRIGNDASLPVRIGDLVLVEGLVMKKGRDLILDAKAMEVLVPYVPKVDVQFQ